VLPNGLNKDKIPCFGGIDFMSKKHDSMFNCLLLKAGYFEKTAGKNSFIY